MSFLFLAAEMTEAAGPWWAKTYPEYLGLNPLHILVMMVPFWFSLASLWFLAIKPIMKIIEEREHRTEGARAEAGELEIKFNDRLKAYETRLAETKQKAAEERQRIRQETHLAEEKVLSAAREESGREIEKVRGAVEQERTRVRSELGKQAEILARELAEKALGRDLGGAAATARSTQPGARS